MAKATKKTYKAKSVIVSEGVAYQPNEKVELTDDQAKRLLELEAIEAAEEEAEAVQAEVQAEAEEEAAEEKPSKNKKK
ncbi:hypothetical protein 055SW001_17 [Bacillus phage 055SW001]|nr:hypothetical protein 022DV001_17 [Bacillus phage 022DV001]QFG05418.1 hypothetical protein 031MP003_18 [Bacillus phage 031MP003]QFG05508.1 hypothetical protein 031MP002_17 [Bacillus phage 031MP002]QFG05769.1 hypothetical protein 055SW001_17 [Bacillus phage 055SW001]